MIDSTAILVGIDVHGIQKYLFATTKLREVIGASRIVDDFTGAETDDIPRYVLDGDLKLKACLSGVPTGEHWYIPVRLGGGVIRVLLPNIELAKQFIMQMSKWATENAAGLEYDASWVNFNIATGGIEVAFPELIQKINSERMLTSRGNGFCGFPFTAPCVLTGDSAANYGKTMNERLCDASLDKRDYQAKSEKRDRWAEILAGSSILEFPKIDKNMPFIFDTDQLGGDQDGGAYMAVVAIDLNSLGEKSRKATGSLVGCEALHKFRAFTEEVTKATRKAFRDTLDNLQAGSNTFSFDILRDCAEATGHLPIRPLVFGGDDLTFLMDARLAVGFTHDIMESFEKQKYVGAAGMAFVKTKSPLSRAIDLAESLVANGKKSGREESRIDFMLCSGEIPADVDCGRADRNRDNIFLTLNPYTLSKFQQLTRDAANLKLLSRSHVRGAVDRYRENVDSAHIALNNLRENLMRGIGTAKPLDVAQRTKLASFLEEKFIKAETGTKPATRYLDCVDLFRFIADPKEAR